MFKKLHFRFIILSVALMFLVSCSAPGVSVKKLPTETEPLFWVKNTQWSLDKNSKEIKKNFITSHKHDSFNRLTEEIFISIHGKLKISSRYTYFSDNPKNKLFTRQFKTDHLFESEGRIISKEKWKYHKTKSGDIVLVFRNYSYENIIFWELEKQYREFPNGEYRLIKMKYDVTKGRMKPGSEWNSGFTRTWDYKIIDNIPVPVRFSENSQPIIELEWRKIRHSGHPPAIGRIKKFYFIKNRGLNLGSCIFPIRHKEKISLFEGRKIEFAIDRPLENILKKFPAEEKRFIIADKKSVHLILSKNNLFLKKCQYHGKFLKEYFWTKKEERVLLKKFKYLEYDTSKNNYAEKFRAGMSYSKKGNIIREEWQAFDPSELKIKTVFIEEYDYR